MAEKNFAQDARDVDGRGFDEHATSASFPPEDVVAVATLEDCLERVAELPGPTPEVVDLFRAVFERAELRLKTHQRVEHGGIVPAVDLEKALPVIKRRATVDLREEVEEAFRALAQAANGELRRRALDHLLAQRCQGIAR